MRLNGLVCVSIILFLSLSSRLLADGATHQNGSDTHDRSYTGKITIHNQTGSDGVFSIWGDNCWVWYPVHMPDLKDGDGKDPISGALTISLAIKGATNTKPFACQEVDIKNGESFTFHLDKANTFSSAKLHPKAFFSRTGFYWWCLNKETNHYVGPSSTFASNEFLNPALSYDITFTHNYKTLARSYYCDIHETH